MLTYVLLSSSDYTFPSLLLNFALNSNPSELMTPSLGSADSIYEPGTLSLRIGLDSTTVTKAATMVFIMFYQSKYVYFTEWIIHCKYFL